VFLSQQTQQNVKNPRKDTQINVKRSRTDFEKRLGQKTCLVINAHAERQKKLSDMTRDLNKRPEYIERDLEQILERGWVQRTYLFYVIHAENRDHALHKNIACAKRPRPKT